MRSLCKLYKTCTNKDSCHYSKPTKSTLNTNSICYDLVSEKNYIIYLRIEKLKKLNEKR